MEYRLSGFALSPKERSRHREWICNVQGTARRLERLRRATGLDHERALVDNEVSRMVSRPSGVGTKSENGSLGLMALDQYPLAEGSSLRPASIATGSRFSGGDNGHVVKVEYAHGGL